MKPEACPNCLKDRSTDEMRKHAGSIRCVYCIERSEKGFIERSIELFAIVRDAAIEADIDEDLAYIAYDNAVDRLLARYR